MALITKLHFVQIVEHFLLTVDQVAPETRLCLQISIFIIKKVNKKMIEKYTYRVQ